MSLSLRTLSLLLLFACTFFLGCELEPFGANRGYKCATDADCLTDYVCKDNKCAQKTASDEQSSSKETTNSDGGNNEQAPPEQRSTPEPGPESGPEPSPEASPEASPAE
ncbi:MAG: hypothetical protein EP343_10765 [Deltaproteobacteria bacterium]|nr:MAG: hypothetical protein EP343_10765 [Deltaproteobacteria bacterium]